MPPSIPVSTTASAAAPAAAPGRPGRTPTPAGIALRRLVRHPSVVVGGTLFAIVILAAVLAPWISPYAPIRANQRAPLEPPGAAHLMGTDRFGRDVFSRVLWGGRLSLTVGVVSVGVATACGVTLGLVAGYAGHGTEAVIMRTIELLQAFPGILLALAVIATLGSSLPNLMIAVGISAIPEYVRITRGAVLDVKQREFVLAARVVGCRDRAILLRHILPNVTAPLVVIATLGIAGAIITGSALSFLGLGIRPPTPEWGNMLAEGREFLARAWWVAFFPGLAIMAAVLAVNLLGDGLRDVLDPRFRG
ncbi:MAG TPA: ABC transporter permease [bacterium]|nr:ABC transporter permease [bacterium]